MSPTNNMKECRCNEEYVLCERHPKPMPTIDNKEGCDKHNHPDCMECFYTTRAEEPESWIEKALEDEFIADASYPYLDGITFQQMGQFLASLTKKEYERAKEELRKDMMVKMQCWHGTGIAMVEDYFKSLEDGKNNIKWTT